MGKSEEQLPQKTVGRLLANSRPAVGQQLADSWTTVGRQSTDSRPTVGRLSFTAFSPSSRPTVGRLSAHCWPHVGNLLVENPCRIPEKPQLAGKNIAYRREMKLSHLSPPYCFGFFRDQSPPKLLCLGFLGTKPLTIPSHHPRSQEAENLFTAASCSFFFFTLLNRNINN